MEATETFQAGVEQATVVITIDLNDVWLISGDFSGTIPQGQIGFINGDVNLTGDLFVEGLLTGIDTFHLQGNGHTVFFQNGGQVALAGQPKAAWGEWGTDTTGWVVGDRLGVAPTAATFNASGALNGAFLPAEAIWQGSWAATTRPVVSPDVVSIGRKPEVVNLGQTIVLENLGRGFHFHDSAGVQNLSDVKFLNCGTAGILGNYPCHFHRLGENSRGSLLERVISEGGKNHAFVPHGSHGITLQDCVAYKTNDDAFWWDPPADEPALNNSNDIAYLHCAVIGISGPDTRTSGFHLGSGLRNRCIDSVVAGMPDSQFRSGFHWPEKAQAVWEFSGCTAHNIKSHGIFAWQNSASPNHLISDFVAYRIGNAGVAHGAYRNMYHYQNLRFTGCKWGMFVLALSKTDPGELLRIENVVSDSPLLIGDHNQPSPNPVIYRNCSFPSVTVDEKPNIVEGYHRFEDCGLVPADFTLTLIRPATVIELVEGGTVLHRWALGSWS